MYEQQNGLALFFDTLGDSVNYIGQQAGIQDKIMRENVKSEVMYASAELERNTQEFLNKLQGRNDYDNFQKYTDEFLTEQKNQFAKKAKNTYAAKMYDQLLMGNRDQLQAQVAGQVMKMQIDDMNANYAKTLETNMNMYTGQTGIDADNTAISSQLASGAISYQQATAKTIETASEYVYKDCYSKSSQIDSYISRGKSFSEFELDFQSEYAKKEYKVSVLNSQYASEEGLQEAYEKGIGFDDISGSIDKTAIQKKAIKALETEFQKKLSAVQGNNFNTARSRLQEQLNTTTDKAAREDIKRREYNIFRATVKNNPNTYSDLQKYELVKLYEPDALKDGEGSSSKKATTFNKDLNDLISGIIDGVQNGKNSIEAGIKTGYQAKDYLKDYYFTNAPAAGLTQDQMSLGWIETNQKFLDQLEKAYKGNGSIAPEIANFNDFLGLCKKNPGSYTANELVDYGTEGIIDALMDVDVSNPEEVKNAVNRIKAIVSENAFDGYSLNKKGKKESSAFIESHVNKKGEIKDIDKAIIDGFYDLQGGNNSKDNKGKAVIAFTDRRGQVTISPYAQEAIETVLDPAASLKIAAALKMDPKDVTAEWETDGKHDLTGRRIYRVGNQTYTIEATKKGIDNYQIINSKTGEVISDLKSIKEADRKKMTQQGKVLQADKFDAAKKNYESEEARMEAMRERALTTKAEDVPEEFRGNWDLMGIEERMLQLEAWDKSKNR